MIEIKKNDSIEQLSELKQEYIDRTTAPLDGMWLTGFVPMADHFGFYENEMLVGYCCINDDGYVLQFYLSPEKGDQASHLFDSILTQNDSAIEKINGAFVSTAEPQFLSLCLDSFSKFEVNALMYRLGNKVKAENGQEALVQLTVVKSDQLSELVAFANSNIGAPEEWLTGYYTNLISRRELYGFWKNGPLLATGEIRAYDEYQTDYADLGVIVEKSQRGKGLGTGVLKELISITESKGLKAICSTEKTNCGAQKAISRAGFIAGNRIIQFDS